MSKKKQSVKGKKKTQQVNLAKIPLEELQKKAELFLKNGHYKKAIENYKAVLSHPGDHGDSLDKLIQAYQGRLKELADKGMRREAIELWEHVARAYGREMDVPFYIEQLFQSGEYLKAVQVLYGHQGKIKDVEWFRQQESIVALLTLAELPGISASIPPDSPILQQKPLIHRALQSCYEGQDDRVSEILQPIGLRSPYRDWKVLLKGLVAFYQHQDHTAQDIFSRIGLQDSPIGGLIPLFNLIMQPPKERPSPCPLPQGERGRGEGPCPDRENHKKEKPLSLKPEGVSFIKEILGERGEVLSLFRSLVQAGKMDNGMEMARILRKLTDYLPEDDNAGRELLRQNSLEILAHLSSKSFDQSYQSVWGAPPDPFEKLHMRALISEQENNWIEANSAWRTCLDVIRKGQAKSWFPTTEEKDLALAQILRRMADHTQKLHAPEELFFRSLFGGTMEDAMDELEDEFGDEFEDEFGDEFEDDMKDALKERKNFIPYLTESLKFDPGNAQTYQQIIAYYRQRGQEKKVTHWLEKFLQVFPGQIDALLESAVAAFKRNAMQKSLRFLDTALQHDPLNEKARNMKISIHLISASLRFKQGKFALVRKDFELARSLLTSKTETGWLQITWGMAEIAMAEQDRGHSLIREGIQLGKDSMRAYFQITIEASLWGVSEREIAPYKKILEKRLLQKPTDKEIRQLVRLAISYFQSGLEIKPETRKKMEIIAPLLEKAIHHRELFQSLFSEEEMLEICHYLAIVHLYPLLVHYAREGKKLYSRNLRFHFFALIGRAQGKVPSFREFDLRMQFVDLENQCERDGNHKMGQEIETFMDGVHPLYSQKPARKTAAKSKPKKTGQEAKSGSNPQQSTLFDEERE